MTNEQLVVTVERGRTLYVAGQHHGPGATVLMPTGEAQALDAAGFIRPLDGSERLTRINIQTGQDPDLGRLFVGPGPHVSSTGSMVSRPGR